MIVVTLTDCPPGLRGDLTKWLLEINTGVYVGQLNRRVREHLWKRICDNLTKGRATMVYSAKNEQQMEFKVHNTTWQPVDFDGLTLMRRPLPGTQAASPKHAPSKAAIGRMIGRRQAAAVQTQNERGYVVIDIETTGLDCETDVILEIAAIRITDHQIEQKFCVMLRSDVDIPRKITELTGITRQMVLLAGDEPASALNRFWDFVGRGPIVGHNLDFDAAFLKKASSAAGVRIPRVSSFDTLKLAKRKLYDVPDYRLATLAAHFGIDANEAHRALPDCITTFRIYEKLNEII